MKKIKKNLIIIFLFMLLFLVAIAPVLLTEISNKRMVDKPIVVSLPKEYLENSKKSVANQNVLKKIQTIVKASTEKTGIVIEKDDIPLTQTQKTNLIDAAKEQINIMQSAGALPQFDISENLVMDQLRTTTYIDSAEPNFAVTVWDIMMTDSVFVMTVTMDTTSNVIYQIAIDLKQDVLSSNTSNNFIQRFFQYLMLDTKKLYYKYNGTEKETYCYYAVDENKGILYTFEMGEHYIEFYLKIK